MQSSTYDLPDDLVEKRAAILRRREEARRYRLMKSVPTFERGKWYTLTTITGFLGFDRNTMYNELGNLTSRRGEGTYNPPWMIKVDALFEQWCKERFIEIEIVEVA